MAHESSLSSSNRRNSLNFSIIKTVHCAVSIYFFSWKPFTHSIWKPFIFNRYLADFIFSISLASFIAVDCLAGSPAVTIFRLCKNASKILHFRRAPKQEVLHQLEPHVTFEQKSRANPKPPADQIHDMSSKYSTFLDEILVPRFKQCFWNNNHGNLRWIRNSWV